MNPETCTVIQAWAGDAKQVEQLMPYWRHHGVPIYIMSPENAPVSALPGTKALTGGERGWSGPHTIERQLRHFELMLELPFDWYFYTDSDALCLTPEFPEGVYQPGVFWSNVLSTYDFWTKVTQYAKDEREGEREEQVREACKYLAWIDGGEVDLGKWHDLCPVVMQPPYFLSKGVLERFLEVAGDGQWREWADFPIHFIDWFYPALCRHSGVDGKGFGFDGISMPMWERHWLNRACEQIRVGGGRWVHSCKDAGTAQLLMEERKRRDAADPSMTVAVAQW